MSRDSEERSARRRAFIRSVMGKPGSWRRWGVGTALWLLAAVALASKADYLARIAIFLAAVIVPMAALKARSLLVGDEDELRADLRAKRASATPPHGDATPSDESDWYLSQNRGFEGAPPAPVSEPTGSTREDAPNRESEPG